ncbi:uncharacterized protein LOC141849568 [Brevipalpus obovatus]|uniref:uncharacterized protein LOC141849568 n=1 Tax=Brevipalpus obovatus TaxID=246614 RepID=UPI003D9F1D29
MEKVIFLTALTVILTSFLWTASAEVRAYNVTVRTAPTFSKQFESVKGKLKLKIKGIHNGEEFADQAVLTPEAIDLENDRTYYFPLAMEHSIEEAQSIEVRWTLKTPYNPLHLVKKPMVYFDDVLIREEVPYSPSPVSSSSDPSLRQPDTIVRRSGAVKRFCPAESPLGIAHSEAKIMESCRVASESGPTPAPVRY